MKLNVYIEVSFRCIVVTLEITTNQHVINMKELYYEAEMQRKQAIGLIVISQDNKVFKKNKKMCLHEDLTPHYYLITPWPIY